MPVLSYVNNYTRRVVPPRGDPRTVARAINSATRRAQLPAITRQGPGTRPQTCPQSVRPARLSRPPVRPPIAHSKGDWSDGRRAFLFSALAIFLVRRALSKRVYVRPLSCPEQRCKRCILRQLTPILQNGSIPPARWSSGAPGTRPAPVPRSPRRPNVVPDPPPSSLASMHFPSPLY
jgi:hypothetical protein